jgi:hypothetical protein
MAVRHKVGTIAGTMAVSLAFFRNGERSHAVVQPKDSRIRRGIHRAGLVHLRRDFSQLRL